MLRQSFHAAGFMMVLGLASTLSANTLDTGTSVARFETNVGNIHIELFGNDAPATVANFEALISAGAYDSMFFHRLVAGFVLQGGGFNVDLDEQTLGYTPDFGAVVNEFGISNTRGTVAMAKLGGDPDSATNQFFFNLADNSANLDNQNGGFTVFGEVLGNDMTTVDLMASLPVANGSSIHSAFSQLPLINEPQGVLILEDLIRVDRAFILTQGDANFDGNVDLLDLSVLASNFGDDLSTSSETGFEIGDFNFDGSVDLLDLSVLASHFGTTAAPEPGSAAVLLIAAWGCLNRRS